MFRWIILSIFIFNFGWAGSSIQDGIALFHKKRYEEALILFEKSEPSDKESVTSLIGQLFCHVALGRVDQIDPTIQLIDHQLHALTRCRMTSDKSIPLTQERQQMSYACRRHVREIANLMRQTVEQLVRDTVPGIFQKIKMLRQLYPFIDTLEQTGIDCCQSSSLGDCCMDPMREQLESWNSFGLPSK